MTGEWEILLDRVPGGSTGGETCLLAAGGTPFGIGSDLAGSLRIPAGHCGVYTLKPTQGIAEFFCTEALGLRDSHLLLNNPDKHCFFCHKFWSY